MLYSWVLYYNRYKIMIKNKILITGSSGFLGKNLFAYFKQKKCKVYGFDLIAGKDLLRDKDLIASLKSVDYVCHLAAVGDVYLAAEDPKLAATIGVGGTANLVKVASKLGNIKKIIYASTWEVYGHPQYQPLDENHPCNPDHPYSISKYGGELMLKSKLNNVPWVILRLGSAYGPYMRKNAVIPLFINQAKSDKKISLDGDGLQTRQFTFAEDIARAFELSIKSSVKNEIFNIVSEETQTIKRIAEMVNKKIPIEIQYGVKRKGDVPPALVSAKKAQRMLSWKAKVRFEDGFKKLFKSLS